MKNAYDWDDASRLVPLFEAIFDEISDRRRAIRALESDLARMKQEGAPERAVAQVVARLAVQRRELRMTSKEIERLGCAVDTDVPDRIVIPGVNGRLENGFHWDRGADDVQLTSTSDFQTAVESGVF